MTWQFVPKVFVVYFVFDIYHSLMLRYIQATETWPSVSVPSRAISTRTDQFKPTDVSYSTVSLADQVPEETDIDRSCSV